MTKLLIVIIILFAGLIIFNVFINSKDNPEDKIISNKKTEVLNIEEDKYTSEIDEQANVTVEISPLALGVEKDQNTFEVSFSTHSVEMDYDFSKVIVLKDDLGNIYEAVQWTGGRGGHHVSGNIIFPAINAQATQVEITVNGVSEVDRVFKWDLL